MVSLLHNRVIIGTLTFVLSLCSFVYELIFSQVLSATVGNTFFCYSLTIGIFIFFMGFGSMIFDFLPKNKIHVLNLAFIEVIMGLNGLIGISVIIYSSALYGSFVFWILSLCPVMICGLLSGLELPFIIKISPKNYLNLLGFDYFGMFAGAVLFPLFLLSYLGIFVSSVLIAFVNLSSALFLLWISKKS